MSWPVAFLVVWGGLLAIVLLVGWLHARLTDRAERVAAINREPAEVIDLTTYAAQREHRANRAVFRSITRHSREFDEAHSFRTRVGVHKEAVAPREWPTA